MKFLFFNFSILIIVLINIGNPSLIVLANKERGKNNDLVFVKTRQKRQFSKVGAMLKQQKNSGWLINDGK